MIAETDLFVIDCQRFIDKNENESESCRCLVLCSDRDKLTDALLQRLWPLKTFHFSRHEIPPTVICCIKKDNSLKCIAQPLKARGERSISIVATYIFLSRTSTKGRRQDSVPVRRSVISLRRLVRSQKLAIFSYGCCPISIYGGWSGQMFSESFVCCNMYGANFSGVLSTFGPQLLK